MQTTIIDLSEADSIIRLAKKKYADRGLVYGWKSNVNKAYDFGHWNSTILSSSKYHYYDHGLMPYLNNHSELKIIWDLIQNKIGSRALLRVYVNGYTFGTDAYYHVDDNWITNKHGDVLTETIIVYLNDEWQADWGGETSILNDENEIETSILPKKNRALIFNSNKLHSARPLSRICPELRTVLVFKTIDHSCISKEVEYILNLGLKYKHTDKSFFEHLYNVSFILENFNLSKDVCAAGMFHSIYGTEFYNYEESSNITREEIKSLIGEYAESLAYEFCNLKNNRLETIIQNTNHYDKKFRRDLLFIELANLLEQDVSNKYAEQIEKLQCEILKLK